MARVYADFNTNIGKIDKDGCGITLDYISFKTDKGHISLSPNWSSDFSLDEDGHFSCRWKGVDYYYYYNGEDGKGEEEYEELTEEIYDIIATSGKIDTVGLYLSENTTLLSDRIMVKDMEVEIDFNRDKNVTITATDSIGIDITGDDRIKEDEYER